MTPGMPFGTISAFGVTQGWDIAIVVPAKDEADRIQGCLAAVAMSAARLADACVGVVVVVNNSSDTTALRCREWAVGDRGGMSVVVVDHHFPAHQEGVGPARRMGIDLATHAMPGNGVVLLTDADTHVSPDWISANLTELADADVVCGKVDAISEEQAALPTEISRHGAWESDYVVASLQLAALLDPLAHDPRPTHHNGAGASMAFRKSVYDSVGGMPALKIGEGRAFVELAEAKDYRIRYSDRPVVRTSCRLIGRTDGGMAGALRDRRDLPDPPSDEWLEPADTFYLRYALRGAVRAVWPVPKDLSQVLYRFLGTEAAALREGPKALFFGEFIQQIEARAQQLTRVRMCQSDCRRELPLLRHLLSQRLADAKFDPPQRSSRAVDADQFGA